MNVTTQELDGAREAATQCARQAYLACDAGRCEGLTTAHGLHAMATLCCESAETVAPAVDTILLACASHEKPAPEHDGEATTWHELAVESLRLLLLEAARVLLPDITSFDAEYLFCGDPSDAGRLFAAQIRMGDDAARAVSKRFAKAEARIRADLLKGINHEWAAARAYVEQLTGNRRESPEDRPAAVTVATWLSSSDLARRHGLVEKRDALDKRLKRWRFENGNGWLEIPDSDRRPREPKYLYDPSAVAEVIDAMKAGN